MSVQRRRWRERVGGLRTCVFLPAAVLGIGVHAQVELRVVDAAGEGVPYAHLAWHELPDGRSAMLVSGPDGRALLPAGGEALRNGIALRVSFVGYVTVFDTLRTAEERTYVLRRSTNQLDELVVTAQYAPANPDKAVHKVRVLDAKRFQRMAANNLGDALRNELNIRLRQDPFLGTSLAMQGLGGENVKLLIDGVPVIGRMDGNIDLAQLDLTGIERVEIVEGPLSVNYGTDALAGTINLITRKGDGMPASLKGVVYAEHIGRLNTTLTATRRWGRTSLLVDGGRNFFGGWDPRQEGLPRFAPAPADTNRSQQWKPREQGFGRAHLRWAGDRWAYGYKGEFLHDRITVRGEPRPPYFETAFDEAFRTLRWDNAVFAEGRAGAHGRINALAAHNRYTRIRNTWFRDLTTLGGELVDAEGMQDTSRFALTTVRGTYAHAPASGRISGEAGIDVNLGAGAGERIAGGVQRQNDLAMFASVEWRATERLTVRPGARVAHNTRYPAPLVPSLNLRWDAGRGHVVRATYAVGFRAPSLKEQFLSFTDVNHDITGNPDLRAERGHHASVGHSYRHARQREVYRAEATLFLNAVQDLIALARNGASSWTYVNIGSLRTAGGNLGAGWDNGHWAFTVGGGLTASLDEVPQAAGGAWLLSPEGNVTLTRSWHRQGWTASLFGRYQGEARAYAVLGDTATVRGSIAPFALLDANAGKRLWAGRLLLTAGCKDILNVRNVDAVLAAGVHGGGGNVPMTTGRTFFVRMELDLRKKP